MNWNEWEIIWRRQEIPSPSAEVDEIRRTYEQRRRKLRANFVVRNIAEGGTGIVLTPVMACIWAHYGTPGWPLGIATFILFVITCVFIVDQVRIWRDWLGPETPVLAKVEAELWELRHQRQLIRTWPFWYLFPILAAIAISIMTLSRLNFGRTPPGLLTAILTTPQTLIWILILVGVIGAALVHVWRGSRDLVLNQIDPRILELETLRHFMLRDEDR